MYKGQIIADCGQTRPLTGRGKCDKPEGLTDALILTDPNALYPLNSEEFLAGIDGWVADNGIMRMLPITGVQNDTVAGGEISTSQVGWGPTLPVGISAASSLFQIEGGLCLYKELAQANGDNYRVFRVDNQGMIYGTVVTRGGVDYFAGFDARIWAITTKASDLTTAGAINLGVYYTSNYENELKNLNAIKLDTIPEGLVGVFLHAGTTSGTAKVVSSCGGDDYTSNFAEQWTTTDFVDNAGASPTNVVYDSTNQILTITPAGSYRVANASVLAASDIYGIEGINQFTQIGT